jgi:hypothetical protein
MRHTLHGEQSAEILYVTEPHQSLFRTAVIPDTNQKTRILLVMTTKPNNPFADKVGKLLDEEKHEELFTEGCCFHFALRLHHDRNIPSVEYCYYNYDIKSITHVWLIGKDYDFDAKGVYEKNKVREIMKLTYDEDKRGKIHGIFLNFGSITPMLLQKKIDEKSLSPELRKRLNDRILWYFDNDSKFQLLRR